MLAQPASSRVTEKAVITSFNCKLATKITSFRQVSAVCYQIQLHVTCFVDKVTTRLWVANAAFTAILDNQRKYGFKDVTSYGTAEGIFWEYVVLYLEFVSTERTCGSLE